MGTPAEHLPVLLSDESVLALLKTISIPPATSIVSFQSTACYHSIYILSFAPGDLAGFPGMLSTAQKRVGQTGENDLILRVSGHHLPKIKTQNEVAIMKWITRNTAIPVPAVIRYDSSTKNAIGHEYMLLTRVPGQSLDRLYRSLDKEQLNGVIDQLTDFLVQLHEVEWHQIGGLRITKSDNIVVGPVLEETFWQVPDIERFWGPGESVETLNICGPFNSYVEYISAHIGRYIYAIRRHISLAFMLDILPRLEAFLGALAENAKELNRVKLRLAHKDLHFGNVMYDPESGKVTAILDWEFSGVVPFTRWDPVRAFLFGGSVSDEEYAQTRVRYQGFVARCAERGIPVAQDAEFSSPKQQSMQLAANFLRAIVEVSPRGRRQDMVVKWKEVVLQNIGAFGV